MLEAVARAGPGAGGSDLVLKCDVTLMCLLWFKIATRAINISNVRNMICPIRFYICKESQYIFPTFRFLQIKAVL